MNISKLSPSPVSNRCSFLLSSWKSVPTEAGCYCLATFDNHVLYVGQTKSMVRRFEEHLADTTKTDPTCEGKAVWFYWLEYPLLQLNSLETAWINISIIEDGKRPILNKIDPPM